MSSMLAEAEPARSPSMEERLHGLVQDALARVAANRAAWAEKLAACGALPPGAIAPSACTHIPRSMAERLLDEHRRIVAAWKLERAACQARLAEASTCAEQPAKRRRLGPSAAQPTVCRKKVATGEDHSVTSKSIECWACEREFPRLVKGKVSREFSRVAKGRVCKDCQVCPPGGNAGFRRERGAIDFAAVKEVVEEACAGNKWIKVEQAPHVSDFLAHLAAASFASPGRCKQTRKGYASRRVRPMQADA